MTGDVVDIHAHLMPVGLPDLAATTGDRRWPRLVPGTEAAGDIMCGPDRFRRVTQACWDPGARLAAMDASGVSTQVISPVPISLTYWADPVIASEFIRSQNDLIAEAAARGDGRLVALGGVPLQDVDRAIDELHRVTEELGMAGLEIGTLVGDEELDSPRVRPFLAEAARCGVPLFVHPIDGAGATRCRTPVGAFGLGMLADTAVAAYSLVYGGVLADLPNLRVCLSHGGGAFPVAHPRLRYMASAMAGDAGPRRSAELDALAGLLWADALVFDPIHVAVSASVFGGSHLMLGSDFPFVDFEASTAAALGSETAGIRSDNARRFLFGEVTCQTPTS
jgi:aminocarboxymuconate-semialdehyde decarboxylase